MPPSGACKLFILPSHRETILDSVCHVIEAALAAMLAMGMQDVAAKHIETRVDKFGMARSAQIPIGPHRGN